MKKNSLRRLVRDLGNLGFQEERPLLDAAAAALGFQLVRPENAEARPIVPAFHYAVWSERPTMVSWTAESTQVRNHEGRSRRVYDAYAEITMRASSGEVDAPVSVLGGSAATIRPQDFRAIGGEQLPPACRSAMWQLSSPHPSLDPATGLRNRPISHQLLVLPRRRLDGVLPTGWLDPAPAIVSTHALLTGRSLDEVVANLRRELDRAGWMCWSLEHGADVPAGLRV